VVATRAYSDENRNFIPGIYFVYYKVKENGVTTTAWVSNLTYTGMGVHHLDPKYIKDMYHMGTSLDITWDGDMAGHTALDLSALGMSGTTIVKVSDLTPTNEELIGGKAYRSDGQESLFDADSINESQFPGARLMLPKIENGSAICGVIIDSVETTENALGLPSGVLTNGTYFCAFPEEGIYVSRIVKEAPVKIPEKYMPDIPYFDLTAMGLPNLTMDGALATLQADCSEIVKALEKGSVKFHFVVNYGQPLEMTIVCSALNIPAMNEVYITGGTFVLQINGTFLPIAVSFNFFEQEGFMSGVITALTTPQQVNEMLGVIENGTY
jgi:hypothetical protein